MHEEGSTPRPTDDNESLDIEQEPSRFILTLYEIRHRLFLIWLLVFALIAAYWIVFIGSLFGVAELYFFIVVIIVTMPTAAIFACLEMFVFFLLGKVFSFSFPDPYIFFVVSVIMSLVAGYVQWGFLFPKAIEYSHEQKNHFPLTLLACFWLIPFLFFLLPILILPFL
ncbi:MAG TPA: hypothetical protein PLV42_03680 [bacterium]|nr:hypothetical protein [bacterium]